VGKQPSRPVAIGDAGGDTLRIKEAIQKREQAKAAGEGQEPPAQE